MFPALYLQFHCHYVKMAENCDESKKELENWLKKRKWRQRAKMQPLPRDEIDDSERELGAVAIAKQKKRVAVLHEKRPHPHLRWGAWNLAHFLELFQQTLCRPHTAHTLLHMADSTCHAY